MDIATEETGHVEMLATMVARLLEGDPVRETTERAVAVPAIGAVMGTFAGQIIMTPPLVVLVLGIDLTAALVLSRVVLSFGISLALAPLLCSPHGAA